ncbi:hypothetical protein VKT23_007748 [Stygiomarasmius scandens]|uniref:type I protein arginine methyltransferase n=1 Tax=Marasmiellus scandens TaxID=2682957 RepID=A0ABR1JKG9_9AGAR
MSIHLHIQKQADVSDQASISSSDSDDDQTFDDWNDSLFSGSEFRIQSLFDDTTVGSIGELLSYDQEKYGVDFDEVWARLRGQGVVDSMGRVRLVNWIRKTKPTPETVIGLTGSEDFFKSDEFLVPVIENDALLQYTPPTDTWSDDSDADLDDSSPSARIRFLEMRLAQVQRDFKEYRGMVRDRMNLREVFDEAKELEDSKDKVEDKRKEKRDDDSHYFESYGYNDIHAVMIQDKIRTSTYAKFILTNPELFEGATVLDVGCGTGILSLFAARAGAKRVYAVDASPVGLKAEEIVRLNNLDHVIKVIRGKIEDVQLPFDEGEEKGVDIIISEWMGYALLYESMLDSVLVAKERFLKKDGRVVVGENGEAIQGSVMVPSECRMMFGLCDASEIKKERVDWWNDVYGFDMSPMSTDIYNEAVIDVVGPHTLLSAPACVKDLHIQTLPPVPPSSPATSASTSTSHPHPLNKFTTPFSLISTTSRKTTVTAFVLYFDTFFTTDGSQVPEDVQAQVVREEDGVVAEVWPLGGGNPGAMKRRKSSGAFKSKSKSPSPAPNRRQSQSINGLSLGGEVTAEPGSIIGDNEKQKEKEKSKIISFSTGPQSIPTHWKHTLFLLREPFIVDEGTKVSGKFICRKSDDNSRELEVEIHYSVRPPGGVKQDQGEEEDNAEDVIVQVFKVR